MNSSRIAAIPWLILAASCLILASLTAYQAIKAANAFIEMITTEEEGLLFQFSLFGVLASFFLSGTLICLVVLFARPRK